jgi:hypothetical protein
LWKRQLDLVTGEFTLGAFFKDGVEGSGVEDFDFACSGRVTLREAEDEVGEMSGGGTNQPWWWAPCECVRGIILPGPLIEGEDHGASPDADESTDPARDVARSRRSTALAPELTDTASLAPSSTESASMLIPTRSDGLFSDATVWEDETGPVFLGDALAPDLDRVMRTGPGLGSLRLRLSV